MYRSLEYIDSFTVEVSIKIVLFDEGLYEPIVHSTIHKHHLLLLGRPTSCFNKVLLL